MMMPLPRVKIEPNPFSLGVHVASYFPAVLPHQLGNGTALSCSLLFLKRAVSVLFFELSPCFVVTTTALLFSSVNNGRELSPSFFLDGRADLFSDSVDTSSS